MSRWLSRVWQGLVDPPWVGDARERHLSRVLNIILLIFLVWGILFEIQIRSDNKVSGQSNEVALLMIGVLALAYLLNRQGHFSTAILLTLGLFIGSTFAAVAAPDVRNSTNLSVLYYLLIAILISDLFFSMRGYILTAIVILTGVLWISLLNPNAEEIFALLFIFSTLVGFSSYHRRSLEKQQIVLASRSAQDQSLLNMEQRRSAQLSLLEEAGRQITESLDEKEILERTIEALVNKFGYIEAYISLLIEPNILEIAAISGKDSSDQPGYRQRVGQGIVGHVAETQKAHVAGDVTVDPYYFSAAKRNGSAVGVPMLDKGNLLGVVYVESAAKNSLQPDDVQTLQTLANQVATSLQKARLYASTQEHLRAMTTLQSISHAITSSLDVDEILRHVIQLLKDSFGYSYIGVYLLEGDVLRLGAQLGYPEDLLVREIPITSGVIGRAVCTKEAQFVPNVEADPSFIRAAYEVRSEIAIPLLKDENVLGVINVESKDDIALNINDVNMLKALAGSVAIAMDNAHLHAEVKRMALTDVVSGLANRRAFEEVLQAEMVRASRYSHPISLIILDLDSFKEYNDKWGHPAGDVRLREIADLLRAKVREPDVAARYGGEEFAIILPDTSKSGAIRLAERLRKAAEESSPLHNGENRPIAGYTISLGVATYPEDATSIEGLLLAADNAELAAKRLGKNRVYAANTSDKIQNL